MRITFLGACAVPLLAAAVAAQPVSPGITLFAASTQANFLPTLAALAPANLTASVAASSSVSQLEFFPIAGQANKFRGGVTINPASGVGAPPGQGGVNEIVFDPVAGTATTRLSCATPTVQNLNAVAPRGFQLSITPDGRSCTYDAGVGFGGPRWSFRASDGALWSTPRQLNSQAGFGPYTFVDGKLTTTKRNPVTRARTTNNITYYSFVDSSTGGGGTNDIVVGTFVISGSGSEIAATVTNIQPLFLLADYAPAVSIHSHHVITGANGELWGWVLSIQVAAGDSDTFFIPGPNDDLDAAQLVYADRFAGWINNGTTLGDSGSSVFAWNDASNADGAPFDIRTVFLTGDSAPLTGGPITLRIGVPYEPTVAYNAQVWLGFPQAPVPVVIPGLTILGNKLGTGGVRAPGELGVFPVFFGPNLPCPTGGLTLPFGNWPAAAAGTATVQAVCTRVDFIAGTTEIVFSNTATIGSGAGL